MEGTAPGKPSLPCPPPALRGPASPAPQPGVSPGPGTAAGTGAASAAAAALPGPALGQRQRPPSRAMR